MANEAELTEQIKNLSIVINQMVEKITQHEERLNNTFHVREQSHKNVTIIERE